MWDLRYSKLYGYVVCYNGRAKMSFRNYFDAKNYLYSKKNVKITPKKEAKMARKSTKRKKLSGNALKQKAYSLLKSGAAKLVYARGKGRSVNTRYSKTKSKKMPKYVYVYELKPRRK